jgi:hypothetical protein
VVSPCFNARAIIEADEIPCDDFAILWMVRPTLSSETRRSEPTLKSQVPEQKQEKCCKNKSAIGEGSKQMLLPLHLPASANRAQARLGVKRFRSSR